MRSLMQALSYKEHYRKTLALSLPVCVSNLGHILVGMVDTLMVGKIDPSFAGYDGTEAQAAVALANSLYILVLVFGIGISYGMTPIVAAADSTGDNVTKANALKNAFYINLGINALLFILLFFASPLLYYLDQSPKVAELAVPFLNVMMLGMIPLSVFFTFKQFAEGLSLTMVTMVVSLVGNGLNILFNWVLIFGHWGFEPMGLQGSCWASFISRVIMALMMFGYVYYQPRFRVYWQEMKKIRLSTAMGRKIFGIGLSTGMQWVFEVGAFSVAVLFMGWIGEDEQAAHQIALSLAAFTYMFASGLSAATSVRVGNQVGMKNLQEARRAGFSGFHIVSAFMLFFALLFLTLNEFLSRQFSVNPKVVELSSVLLLIAAVFQLFDGLQVVALGALRGMEDTRTPTSITLIAYWVVGLPACYLLAFPFGLGPAGIWYGLSLGLAVAAVLLLLRFNHITRGIK
ncbi:MAG: MATE family efflux transporter [Bacteroidota bacterium]